MPLCGRGRLTRESRMTCEHRTSPYVSRSFFCRSILCSRHHPLSSIKLPSVSRASRHNITTNMIPIEEALAQLHLEDKLNIFRMAKKSQVDRTNLGKQFNNERRLATQKYENQQLLSLPQETTLIAYINRPSELGLPPTAAMLRNFATDIAGKLPE